MLINDYILYAIKHGYLKDIKWYYSMLTIPLKDTKYIKLDSKKDRYVLVLEDGEEELNNITLLEQPLRTFDKVTVTNEYLKSINKTVDTRLGILIANYNLIEYPFNGKLAYVNGDVSIGKLEKQIAQGMASKPESDVFINIPEYMKYTKSVDFLSQIADIVTISATKKNILPPPGLIAFRNKTIKELQDKYGPHALEDYSHVVELENKLKKFDDDYLKDDPTYGKFTSGKVKNIARVKMYLNFGAERGFDTSNKATYVDKSLLEGYPLDDAKKMAVMYNTVRAGSYDRGVGTQEGGVVGKILGRATNSIKIVNHDCGTKIGKRIVLTKDNIDKYLFRNIIVNNKTIELDTKETANKYLNKEVMVRSPLYCIEKNHNLCAYCVDDKIKNYPNGMSLIVTDISAIILNTKMKSMHGKVLSTVKINMNEIVN